MRSAAAGAAVRLPLWLLVSPRDAGDAPGRGAAGAGSCGGGGCAQSALLEDLLVLAMPDDGTSGRGAFWEGDDYDGGGTGADDDANLAFREVDGRRGGGVPMLMSAPRRGYTPWDLRDARKP
jgi:hypothetical protein